MIRPFIRPWQLGTVLAVWLAATAISQALFGVTSTAATVITVLALVGSIVVVTLIQRGRS